MNGGGVGPRDLRETPRQRRDQIRALGDAARGWTPVLVLVLTVVLAADRARAAGDVEDGSEVRIRSGPGTASVVTVHARPEITVEDRTAGAKPASGDVASSGETFAGDVTLFLHGHRVTRPATIEVVDPVVSAVRLFPEKDGTTVAVFVRLPVAYTVSQPSPTGDVRIELHGKARPLTVVTTPRGKQKTKRPAQEKGEGEVAVDAETLSYDQQSNTLTARGGVTLTRGDTTITADEVIYDRTNSVAEAKGHVVVTDPQGTVRGSFAHLNVDDESGWVESADATLQPTGYSLIGGRIVKRGGPQYSVANGIFTTCECGGLERPSWSLACKQADVEVQGTGVARGATFRVKDVPVLYFPYLVFPAATERQTGFLMPRIGYSNKRGFQYEQPFFWAINKSSDATLGFDVETAARVGVSGEYRYVLSNASHGHFAAAYYNQQIGGAQPPPPNSGVSAEPPPENRWLLAGRHTNPFYGGSKLYLDMLAVSDDEFLRDIDTFSFVGSQDVALRTLRFTTTRAEVQKTWAEGLAEVDTTYHQDLIDPQAVSLQRLPNALAEHDLPIFDDRLVARFGGEATDFWREEGFDGLRADIVPELFLPFHLSNVVSGSLTGQLRETAYHLFDRSQVAVVVPNPGVTVAKDFEKFRATPGELPDLEENRARELAAVNGRVGTTFQRVYDFPHLGLSRVMHTIEPEVQYLFVPEASRPQATKILPPCTALPTPKPGVNCDATLYTEGFLFDERDAINRRNFLSWGLTTRLLGRAPVPAPAQPEMGPPAPVTVPVDSPRELLRATILHGYDVSRTLVDNSHLSDVDLGLRLTPVDYLALTYNTTVNLQQGEVRGRTVTLQLREPGWVAPPSMHNLQAPSAIGIGYRFIQNNVNQDIGVNPNSPEAALFRDPGVDEINGGVYLRLGNYLGFTFLSRYTLDTTDTRQPNGQITTLGPHFLERDYIVRLISRCNCWSVDVGVADKFNPDERLFRIQLNLVGLGSFGQGSRMRNYVGVGPVSQTGPASRQRFGGLY